MTQRRKVAAGNWKMNGRVTDLLELDQMATISATCDVILGVPATLISAAVARSRNIMIAAQDCHAKQSGAFTGDISAEMLADTGAKAVIVGHSERRALNGETSEIVRQKAEACHRANLVAIICVGETEAQRDANETLAVNGQQIAASVPDQANAANTIIAYEPVWAIGTGRTPTLKEIAEVHDFLRGKLTSRFRDGSAFRILYGGSVKPGNAAEIFAVSNVDGGLVGGASLRAADFGPIIMAAGA